jgi:predicted metal-dependent hydrolase
MSAQLSLFSQRDASSHWQVRVSRRARRLSVRVYPGGRVEVVVPPDASALSVQRFIGQHRAWIDRRVRDLAPGGVTEMSVPTVLELPALARSYVVEYRHGEGDPRVRQIEADRIVVSGAIDDVVKVSEALRRWLTNLAVAEFTAWTGQLGTQHSLHFDRVQVRRQRTRWGSCSAAGTISLNLCLLFLEPDVVRYLLIHELCHTRHMNHSSRFWALVAECEPGFRELDRALTRGWRSVPGWMFN